MLWSGALLAFTYNAYSPHQLVQTRGRFRVFALLLNSLLDKPWSQASPPLPPRLVLASILIPDSVSGVAVRVDFPRFFRVRAFCRFLDKTEDKADEVCRV